jgi:hypothetical protein
MLALFVVVLLHIVCNVLESKIISDAMTLDCHSRSSTHWPNAVVRDLRDCFRGDCDRDPSSHADCIRVDLNTSEKT